MLKKHEQFYYVDFLHNLVRFKLVCSLELSTLCNNYNDTMMTSFSVVLKGKFNLKIPSSARILLLFFPSELSEHQNGTVLCDRTH